MAATTSTIESEIFLNAFGTKIVKQECFNPNVFKDIILHEGVSDDEKKRLKQYYRRRVNGNSVEVKYDYKKDCKVDGFARVYAEKGLSLQMFSREIRNALGCDYYFDLDMHNAHPSILLKMCKDRNWVCDKLEFYVNNRQDVLDEVSKHYNTSNSGAKQIMNTMMYLGGIPLAVTETEYDFLDLYRQEMFKIAENVKHAFSDHYKLVSKKKETNREKMSSCLSYVITTEEHKILMCINNYLESKGRNVDVLIYDGCLVRKLPNEVHMDEEIIKQCEEFITQKTGYTIKLVVKPMISTLKFKTKINVQGVDYKDGVLRNYDIVKPLFEETHLKLRNPMSYCEIGKDGVIVMRKKKEFKEVYENLWAQSKLTGEKGNFVEEWMKDPSIRTYDKMDLVPPPKVCPPNVFNMWNGYAIDKIECESSGNYQPFIDLVSVLVSHEKEHLDYVVKWFAHLVQYPAEIIGIILTIIGEEGIGKNFCFHQFAKMIGNDYYFETADPENDLFSKHAIARLNRFLICIDEGKKKDMFANRDKLWNMITADTWNYEKKGVDTVVLPNYCRFVITTNHDVVIPPGRRGFIVNASSEKFGNKKYFDEMSAYFDDHANQKAIMEYLRSIDLSTMNWITDKPKNDTMDGLISVCGCEVLRFLEYEYLLKRFDCPSGSFKEKGKPLAEEYCNFLTKKLMYKDLNVNEWTYKLFNKLKRYMDSSNGAIVKTIPGNVATYTFELESLKAFLQSKGFLANLDCYMLLDLEAQEEAQGEAYKHVPDDLDP